jgi:hypothetical protein
LEGYSQTSWFPNLQQSSAESIPWGNEGLWAPDSFRLNVYDDLVILRVLSLVPLVLIRFLDQFVEIHGFMEIGKISSSSLIFLVASGYFASLILQPFWDWINLDSFYLLSTECFLGLVYIPRMVQNPLNLKQGYIPCGNQTQRSFLPCPDRCQLS